MTIRFAILAGVSTDAQAREEKLSIPDQVKFCRAKIAAHDGLETIEPFILDGYSRTGYDSLDVAMSEIPPLAEAIRAAQSDLYDVLIMDNFDRLGDLGLLVYTRFKKYKKQLYSARQSGKLASPADYDPYASEDSAIDMYVQGIIQTYRIHKIRRGWNVGVPQRASLGLHSLSISYGYKIRAKNEPAEPIPHEVALIRQMKDWYLAGRALQEICEQADASGVKPRRADHWQRAVIKRILHNPYYAGRTVFGRFKLDGDQRVAVPPSQWVTGQGRHQPLWDQSTYLAILAETERRDGLRARVHVYALTGLCECSVCGTRLHRHGKTWHYIYCRAPDSHIHLRYEAALELVADAIIAALQTQRDHPLVINSGEQIQEEINGQQELRARIQQGFESKLYTALEAQRRIVSVETEIERLIRKRDRAAQQSEQTKALLAFAEQDLDRLRAWIIHDDPTTVNHLLTTLCEKVIISPEKQCRVVWRA